MAHRLSTLSPESLATNGKSGFRTIASVVALSSISALTGALVAKPADFPVFGPESLMNAKLHSKLRWACDVTLSDKICNFNRNWAEFAGYWTTTNFLKEVDPADGKDTTFFDSVTGVPLFRAPVGRTFEQWKGESLVHGWPSFRDNEVIWDNVRSLKNGEMVSLTGTHLGHNLPDRSGNRYCINLVSIAGYPIQ
eukprot:gene33079-42793_t